MTISIGVAPLRDTTPDLAALLVEADAALYQAKRQGRNAVCQDAAVPKDG
jgi:diguanylate cyclase (GGDEF)-like protein